MIGKFLSSFNFIQKDKKLGVSAQKSRYDLPLHHGTGNTFLLLLIALMTFLGTLSLTTSFGLQGVAERWSSGLENSATIEIPALDKDKKLRNSDELNSIASKISKKLENIEPIKSFKVLDKNQVANLLEPWLGEDIILDKIPLPMLISIEMKTHDKEEIKKLQNALLDISKDIRVETHEEWLGEIIKLTSGLKFGALLITLVIGITTTISIAGAIRSRMAEHNDDIQLLHLMGASDKYIVKQFQKHAVHVGLKGAIIGSVCALILLIAIGFFTSQAINALLPDFRLNITQWLTLLSIPAIMCGVAFLTARITVLGVLKHMP